MIKVRFVEKQYTAVNPCVECKRMIPVNTHCVKDLVFDGCYHYECFKTYRRREKLPRSMIERQVMDRAYNG